MDGPAEARKVVSRWRKRPAIGVVNNKSGVGWTEIMTPKPRHVKKRGHYQIMCELVTIAVEKGVRRLYLDVYCTVGLFKSSDS